jgi:hypothetical protein
MKCVLMRSGHEMSTHYFSCSGGRSVVLIKSVLGHIMPNLCFYTLWDLRFTLLISPCPGRET